MWRVVLATGTPIFVKENVFIAVHNFDAPVFTVEREQVLWRSFFRRQTCNQIDNFLFDGLPRAFLFALDQPANATNLFDGAPRLLNIGSFSGQHINEPLFNPAVSFVYAAVVTFEGEKPAL